MTSALGSWQTVRWIMQPQTKTAMIATIPNSFAFVGASTLLLGIPVVDSTNSPQQITLLDCSDILFADGGLVSIDKSMQASVVMDNGASPASTETVSLWQTNKVGLRAERQVSWLRAHDDSVVYMTVTY
jgi:hypothetical protein